MYSRFETIKNLKKSRIHKLINKSETNRGLPWICIFAFNFGNENASCLNIRIPAGEFLISKKTILTYT